MGSAKIQGAGRRLFSFGGFMEFLHTLYYQYPGMFHLYIGILGLLVGSFLNVVVYRLPVMMENEYRRD